MPGAAEQGSAPAQVSRAGALVLLESRPGQWVSGAWLAARAGMDDAALADVTAALVRELLTEERPGRHGGSEWRILDMDDPMGPAEIAAWLGRERGTVDKWRQRGIFPPPEPTTVGGRPWWRRRAVRDWAIATGRTPERFR